MQPALDLFAKLAEQKRLLTIGANPGNMEKGEIEVGIVWDFNALNYRNLVGKDKFDVLIPSDGSVTSGYTTTINAYAKRPNIAKMVREHIFTEEGQITFARGFARPILIDPSPCRPMLRKMCFPRSNMQRQGRSMPRFGWTPPKRLAGSGRNRYCQRCNETGMGRKSIRCCGPFTRRTKPA